MKHLFLSLIFCGSLINQATASNELGFLCYAENYSFNGNFSFDVKITGFIEKTKDAILLHNYEFNYQIINHDYIWSELNHQHQGSIEHDKKYNPRRYTKHFRFDLSENVNGTVKLLIPHSAFSSTNDQFKAVLIMTNIEDHAGDTVFLKCAID
jgi:hypothetical protein